MEIKLINLHIQNFKGLKELDVDFDGHDVDIFADNCVGKTSIYDAFSWLLFDKNSLGATSFDVKPYGAERPQVTVTGIISVDGKQITLKKMMEESYTQKRGEEKETFTGHANNFWINDIPKKVGEYKAFIDAIVSEDTFKRLTNANYFLSMKKPEMRRILIDMAGDVDNMEIAGDDAEQIALVELMLDKGYSIDDLLKLIKQNVSLYETEQKQINPRIDERRQSIPETEIDYSKLEEGLIKGNDYISQIDAKLNDTRSRVSDMASKNAQYLQAQNRVNDYKSEMLKKINEKRIKEIEQKNLINSHSIELQGKIANLTQQSRNNEDGITGVKNVMDGLKVQYIALATEKKDLVSSEFVLIEEGAANCDKCGQVLPADKITEMNTMGQLNFNTIKNRNSERIEKALADVINRGNAEKARKETLELQLKEYTETKEKLSVECDLAMNRLKVLENSIASTIEAKEIDLTGDPEYDRLFAEYKALETEIMTVPEDKNAQYLAEKANVQLKIDEIKRLLANKNVAEEAQKRIDELTARGRELAGLIAEEKATQYQAERFIRAKAERLQDSINSMFENLSFRLFDVQINGGIVDDCTPLIHEIEYSSASNSERIRCSAEIVKAMQKYENKYITYFLDNAEACTHYIDMRPTQVIKLIVSASDKKLRIEKGEVV